MIHKYTESSRKNPGVTLIDAKLAYNLRQVVIVEDASCHSPPRVKHGHVPSELHPILFLLYHFPLFLDNHRRSRDYYEEYKEQYTRLQAGQKSGDIKDCAL
jgi:hypothetical protein